MTICIYVCRRLRDTRFDLPIYDQKFDQVFLSSTLQLASHRIMRALRGCESLSPLPNPPSRTDPKELSVTNGERLLDLMEMEKEKEKVRYPTHAFGLWAEG